MIWIISTVNSLVILLLMLASWTQEKRIMKLERQMQAALKDSVRTKWY